MKLTITSSYIFPPTDSGRPLASLLAPAAWDSVRVGSPGDPFFLPAQRNAWVKLCNESVSAQDCATSIVAGLTRRRLAEVFSVGVGRACVEFHLKRMLPQLRLVCTDYGPLAVARLRTVFGECENIHEFDFLRGEWPRLEEDGLVLLNRVDTELTDDQWRQVFAALAARKINRVLVIATGFLNLRTLALETWTRIRGRFGGATITHAGYLRTRDRFTELWAGCYEVEEEGCFSGLTGFWLTLVERN